MPGRPHQHGEEPESPGFRPRATAAHSVRAAEDAVADTARAGRAGGSRDQVTAGSGPPGGRPEGKPTRIGPKEDAETRRSLERENSAAVTLADHGFNVKQNPTKAEVEQARFRTGDTGSPLSTPDYLVEGRVFDCYSPSPARKVRGIWSEVEEKVIVRRQTQRVVIDLSDWSGDLSALRRQFADWPIPMLKEAKAITPSGDIVQLDLHPDNY